MKNLNNPFSPDHRATTKLTSPFKIQGVGIAALLLTALAWWGSTGTVCAQTIRTGPSVFCHMTDGAFTDCDPNTAGIEEWFDIDFLVFQNAKVYTDQRIGASPSLFLMYDLINHQAPLGPTEHFDIQFDTSEAGTLEHYEVQCFGNGSMQVLVNGLPEPPNGIACAVGFSGNVRVELEVPLNVVYSPNIPLFWSASGPPPTPPQTNCPPGTPPELCCQLGLLPKEECCRLGLLPPELCQPPTNCPPGIPPEICDQCRTNPASNPTLCCSIFPELCHTNGAAAAQQAGQVVVSATITQANSDGTTTVAAVPPGGVKPGDLCVIVGNLIDSICPPTRAYKNHGAYVRCVAHEAAAAVASLVNSGVISAAEGEQLQSCVVSPRARSKVGKSK